MFINDMSSDNRTWRNKAYTNEIVDQQNLPFRYYMIHDYKMFIDVLNIVNNWRSGDWYIVAAFAHVHNITFDSNSRFCLQMLNKLEKYRKKRFSFEDFMWLSFQCDGGMESESAIE